MILIEGKEVPHLMDSQGKIYDMKTKAEIGEADE